MRVARIVSASNWRLCDRRGRPHCGRRYDRACCHLLVRRKAGLAGRNANSAAAAPNAQRGSASYRQGHGRSRKSGSEVSRPCWITWSRAGRIRRSSPGISRHFLDGEPLASRTAPFEALKVEGYKSISSPLLREKLISFYEDHYRKLEYSSFVDRDLAIEKVQPYFFRNFVVQVTASKDIDGGNQGWIPQDYDKIKAESYVANLCRFRADILRRFDLQHYSNTTSAMREILGVIDQELTPAN